MTPLEQTAFDYFSRVQTCRNPLTFAAEIKSVIEAFGFEYAMISRVPAPGDRFRPNLLYLAYPKQWIDRYAAQNYATVDPVLRQMRITTDPKIWSRVPAAKGSKSWQMMNEAADYGLRDGVAVPIVGGRGVKSLVTFATSRREFHHEAITALMLIAICSHYVIQTIVEGETQASANEDLTARELECVKWLASGKSRSATAGILSISPHTVKFHLTAAAQKLGARTGPQLVVAAFRRGLVN